MGRWTKTLIPTTSALLTPKTITPSFVQKKLTFHKAQQKFYYDRHAKRLPMLNVGESVLMQMKDGNWTPTKVTSVSQTAPWSYYIKTPERGQYHRNRRLLRPKSGAKQDVATKDIVWMIRYMTVIRKRMLDINPHLASLPRWVYRMKIRSIQSRNPWGTVNNSKLLHLHNLLI